MNMPSARHPLFVRLLSQAAVLLGVWLAHQAAPIAAEAVDYRVVFAGDSAADLVDKAREASQLVSLAERPPASLSALEKRAERDLDGLRKVLRAEGYYGADVSFAIDRSTDPVTVTLTVRAGPPYNFVPPRVLFEAPSEGISRLDLSAPLRSLEAGAPARAVAVVEAETAIVAALNAGGFPHASAAPREVIVDHAAQTVRVTFRIVPGAFARFGDTTISGSEQADVAFVRRRIKWTRGERYDPRLVQQTRRALSQTRLFNRIRITHADAVDDGGALAMEINVDDARPRIIGAGVGYSSNEGPGARGFWEHRNLFGAGERLRLELGGNFARRGATGEFVVPDVLTTDQSLIAAMSLAQEDTEAFESESIETSLLIERPFSRSLAGRAGVTIERSFVKEDNQSDRFLLVGLPLQLLWDGTDDALDPTRGARARAFVTPFVGPLGSDLTFVSARIEPSAYVLLDENRRVVLAGWSTVGTIGGASTEDLPADHRFFSGGGGSVRGYGFQLVGPLDEAGDPLGGRSIFEVGAEIRARVYGDFGGVLFLEGGNVFDSEVPSFDEELLFGAGFGIRYFSGIGPIRFDVAFPLDDRGDVDDPFQIYVSIGQAF